jgi:hypothetical protein
MIVTPRASVQRIGIQTMSFSYERLKRVLYSSDI